MQEISSGWKIKITLISYFIKGIKDFDVIKQLFLLQIFDINDQ
ncbi:hypothetical protein [Mycoplasma phocimorsus]|nr:hypothetical protein [Mycoplasma phocimorsus]MDJ1648412.1 hypothetical protein [Mycoplasma phocimorsus]